MSRVEEDVKTVEAALRAARSHACANRYGGLNDLWEKLNQAQEALQRLEEIVRVRQLSLFE
jgi:plasmid replication initiation protein